MFTVFFVFLRCDTMHETNLPNKNKYEETNH